MTRLVDHPTGEHLTNLVDAIGELEATILDMHGSVRERDVAAIHIGDAAHASIPARGCRTNYADDAGPCKAAGAGGGAWIRTRIGAGCTRRRVTISATPPLRSDPDRRADNADSWLRNG